jgi:Na+/proline symporter
MAAAVRHFEVWDWLLFGLMLGVSVTIGIVYAVRGRRQGTTTQEFLMGGRNLQMMPVAVSMLVSYMSAILILGTPAEMYTAGTQYFLYVFGLMAACLVAALLFVPLLYPLKLVSSYEVSTPTRVM